MSRKLDPNGEKIQERLVAELGGHLQASDQFPTTRVLSSSSLRELWRKIREKLKRDMHVDAGTFQAFLGRMEALGLASKVELSPNPASARSSTFYLIGLGESSRAPISPFELLQALEPRGIICYLSAIKYHELTTQVPAHHHIATVSEPRATRSTHEQPSEETKPTRTRDTLGSLAFSYNSVGYYTNKRTSDLLVDYRAIQLDFRTIIRVTSKSQTLFDSLLRPISCGGPEIVFEAWERVADSFPQKELSALLRQTRHSSTSRRIGTMMNIFDIVPSEELASVIRENALISILDGAPISLLPGLECHRLDRTWNVLVP